MKASSTVSTNSFPSDDRVIARRHTLKTLAGGIALAASGSVLGSQTLASQTINFYLSAVESTENSAPVSKSLALYNTHTGHTLDVQFHRDGKFDEDALEQLNIFLRDHRENEATVMDPMLYMQLWAIRETISQSQVKNPVIHIISGYRTPKTNQMLREKSGGVAKNSYHMFGRAIDFRIPGVSTRGVRDIARTLEAAGVGYYAGSNFVHIDTGEKRHWG